VVLTVAGLLRLYDLNLVPLHHDEGVNGNFLMRLFREGYYHYDPANYHGPTLYYFALLSTYILGPTTFAIRLTTALFGLATVWLVLALRWRLGTVAALAGAALLAVSPGAVYMSRYFIHESLFLFFTLAVVYAALKYWDEGQPPYLIFAAISAALLFATKETAIINAGVLLIALASALVYVWLRRVAGLQSAARDEETQPPLERMGGWGGLLLFSAAAVGVFLAIYVLFYSSFFSNWKGVSDSLETFKIWTRTGRKDHVHSWSTYLEWLWQEESPLLLLGGAGTILAIWRGRNRLAIFAALWAFGILAAYSLVPYKTPWLALNFIVPLAIVGGYAIGVIYRGGKNWQLFGQVSAFSVLAVALGVALIAATLWGLYQTTGAEGSSRLVQYGLALTLMLLAAGLSLYQIYAEEEWRRLLGKMLSVALLAAALGLCVYQSITLNFFNYDDDHYPYVYAHTRRETLALVEEIERLAQRGGTKNETGITIVSPDYWPLPWYLRDYKKVGYFAQMTTTNEPLIIAREDQSAQFQATYADRYRKVGSYILRPGVNLVLYARRDFAQ
jgi:uncharacterized protein (TIGR03663 family)